MIRGNGVGDGVGPVVGERAADRFCAWAGRSRRRVVFTVHALTLSDDYPEGGTGGAGVLLGVLRDGRGRRVLWSASVRDGALPPRIRRAVLALRQDGRGELHHCAVAGGPALCDALLAELGLPPLDGAEPLPLAC